MCSRSLSSCARTSCSATAISFCIAWYSLLVFTSISCPLYLDNRPWTAASSFSTSRRAAWLARDALLDARRRGRSLGDPRLERLLRGRQLRDAPPRPIGREIEVLKLDEVLEIWMHQRMADWRLLIVDWQFLSKLLNVHGADQPSASAPR